MISVGQWLKVNLARKNVGKTSAQVKRTTNAASKCLKCSPEQAKLLGGERAQLSLGLSVELAAASVDNYLDDNLIRYSKCTMRIILDELLFALARIT